MHELFKYLILSWIIIIVKSSLLSPNKKRELAPLFSCQERWTTPLTGTFVNSAWWVRGMYGILTQYGQIPVVSTWTQTNLNYSIAFDFAERSGSTLTAFQVQAWDDNVIGFFIIGFIRSKPDSSKYLCLSKLNSTGVVDYIQWFDTPLLGNYHKTTNINVCFSNYKSSGSDDDFIVLFRSATYNGIIQAEFFDDTGNLSRAELMRDSTFSNPIDGQIIGIANPSDGNPVSLVKVTTSSSSEYNNYYILTKTSNGLVKWVYRFKPSAIEPNITYTPLQLYSVVESSSISMAVIPILMYDTFTTMKKLATCYWNISDDTQVIWSWIGRSIRI